MDELDQALESLECPEESSVSESTEELIQQEMPENPDAAAAEPALQEEASMQPSPGEQIPAEEEKKDKGFPWWLILILSLIVIGGGFLLLMVLNAPRNLIVPEESKEISLEVSEESEESHILVENPKDFVQIRKDNFDNEDIYAWIEIPGTKVDYPMTQSPADVEDDDYYLHKGLDKNYLFAGTIYTQKSLNKKDFNDRMTVIYGHSMLNKTMFGSLHSFADKDFFDEHSTFTVYTEKHILTYEIISAYEYSDCHLMYAFDFSNDKVFEDYLKFISNPTSYDSDANYRKVSVDLNKDSKIITLSTCMSAHGTTRYLIQAVQIDDQWTY